MKNQNYLKTHELKIQLSTKFIKINIKENKSI